MWANHPKMASGWERATPGDLDLPDHVPHGKKQDETVAAIDDPHGGDVEWVHSWGPGEQDPREKQPDLSEMFGLSQDDEPRENEREHEDQGDLERVLSIRWTAKGRLGR